MNGEICIITATDGPFLSSGGIFPAVHIPHDVPFSTFFARESQRFRSALSGIDRQTAFVLLAAAVFVILQDALGSRRFFRAEIAHFLPADWRGLLSWGWWFGIQAITGFVLPAACLFLLFKKRPAEMGLGLGDWKLALGITAVYLPLVVIGTWVLSDSAAFQSQYPHYRPAVIDWGTFAAYQALFLMYWIGWEYLWRGFVLFGTAPTLGLYAIFVQAVPFAILHLDKPLAEAVLSLVGGVALGALVWRCRSFWIAVPIHAAQMMILDFWCTMRIRGNVDGIGLDAVFDVLTF